MAINRDGLYVHVAWLSKMMGGDTHCRWSPWFRARYTGYKKKPADSQITLWTIEHTQLLGELIDERRNLNETAYVESQNTFKIKRSSGLVVAGKPDLVTINPESKCKVFDAKTGEPKQSDVAQVLLYMMLLPYAFPRYKKLDITGCVVYKNHGRIEIPRNAIDEKFTKNVSYFLNILQSEEIPPKSPSVSECRFCDIGEEDCTEREILTEERQRNDVPEVSI